MEILNFCLNFLKKGPDPRTWAREDVVTFLRWCEREFDLPGLDLDKFQMNGTWQTLFSFLAFVFI